MLLPLDLTLASLPASAESCGTAAAAAAVAALLCAVAPLALALPPALCWVVRGGPWGRPRARLLGREEWEAEFELLGDVGEVRLTLF